MSASKMASLALISAFVWLATTLKMIPLTAIPHPKVVKALKLF